MIELHPVPEGLLKRALDTTFTTESWPEWDELDLVPDFDGSADIDDLDFEGDAEGDDDQTANEDTDAPATDADSAAEQETDSESDISELPDPLSAFEDSAAAASDQFDPFEQLDLDLDDFDFS